MDDDRDSRILELEGELAALRRLFGLSEVPTFTVDLQGVVVSTNRRWFGGGPMPDCVGQPLWSMFAREAWPAIQRSAAAGWIGVSALHLQLDDGRQVALTATQLAPDQWMVAVRDISRRALLEGALDLRRQLGVLSDFAGAVARELIDPISVVQGRLELMLSLGVSDAETAERHVGVALEHARRVTSSLRNLRLVGRSPIPSLQAVDVPDVIVEAFELLGPRQTRVQVEIEPDQLTAGGDASVYARVIASLLRAALEGAGRSAVLLRARGARDGVEISVGPVGRPRGEPDASRTGFALESILLASVGGQLVAWRRGSDRHFEARLPAPPVAPKTKRPVEHALLLVGTNTFHEAVQHVLELDGFRFHCVSSAHEAFDLLEGQPEVDLVGIELIQPDQVSGIALAEGVVARHPELAGRVLVAGQPRVGRLDDGIVGVSWPIRRREWMDAMRRRPRR